MTARPRMTLRNSVMTAAMRRANRKDLSKLRDILEAG